MFGDPDDVAVDPTGTVLYVADTSNHYVRKVVRSGCDSTTSTIAGNGTCADVDGGATALCSPTGVALDPAGHVYVVDSTSASVLAVGPGGDVTTFAQLPAPLTNPSIMMIAADSAGTLYVTDDSCIEKVSPTGTVTTLAGNCGAEGYQDGPASSALFSSAVGIAVDAHGNVYVADLDHACIRKIATDGTVTTLAGNGQYGSLDGTGGPNGTAQFQGPVAQFPGPLGVTVDAAGNLYVADGQTVRSVDPQGNVTTLAGEPGKGCDDGAGATAGIARPIGMSIDGAGNVYAMDAACCAIREIFH